MAELCVSLGFVGSTVLLCEAGRTATRFFPPRSRLFLQEFICTFQLCCCTQELKLLGDRFPMDLRLGLSLVFGVTLIHVHSFREATCNPCSLMEKLYRGSSGVRAAGGLAACQFGAALAARAAAASFWSLGLSPVHKFGFRCFDPIGGTLLEAAAMEMTCAFTVQAAAMHVHKLESKFRACLMAALITLLVYTGAEVSGAVFNPVLAFSVLFPCSGHSYLDYCSVYWLAPLSGVASCILLFDNIIPFLSGQSSQKHKAQ